ncbi:MAG TPA: hypothetical protein VIM11_23545 [Tepidisphaeraceae bacterium]|jgi:hypothetical protein
MAIGFSCKCNFKFSLPDEEAGGLIQCPKCGLLNDIPLHQDLASITDEGLYKLDEAPVLDNPEAAAELIYVYTRGALDVHGDDKDMRISDEELDEARGEMVPLDDPIRTGAPRYDPETGELIHSFELSNRMGGVIVPDPDSIPMAKASATLNYAIGGARHELSLARGFAHLFSPPNMAVMFAIFLMHAFLWPVQFVVSAGVFFLGIAVPPMMATIASHYGNVIEDLGPFEKDDLPRPLRDIEWYGDIWLPFCNLFGSLLICYGLMIPLSIILTSMPELPQAAPVVLAALVAGIGTFFFPAILLTLVGSGTPLNLRPDRVAKVISRCGPAYFFTTIVWIAAGVSYLWGFVGSSMAIASSMQSNGSGHWYLRWVLVVPMLAGGIILMHYFCYCVAMMYRAHHREFPWVLQRHVRASNAVVAPPKRPIRKPQAITGKRR